MAMRKREVGFVALAMLVLVMLGRMAPAATPTPAQPGPADDNAPKEFSTTASGLKYRVLRKSNRTKPVKTDTVTVHYKGWLNDGYEFDSSYKNGKPATFRLDQVIPGWTEGVQLCGEGGMIELEIPPQLGYGRKGMPGVIPPQATLHFIVELVRVR
jgi:FKBP-type peptidyl-prolyl cis-trans isomerase FkpA